MVQPGTKESLDELLAGYEKRIADLERKDIDRETLVNRIEVIYERIALEESLTITTVDFCTWTAGGEQWGSSSTGTRVGFLQACNETWV